MKLMFASDIHGSASCCDRMLSRYRAENAQKLILLGDLLYHGPRNDIPEGYAPKDVARQLNEAASELLCVRGNCEAEVDQMMLSFPVMADYAALWNESGRLFFCTHGHLYDKDNMPMLNDGDVTVQGHTHLYAAEKHGRIYYVNTGSVTLPKGGNVRSYVIYEDGIFTVRDMNGEILKELVL